MSRIEELKTYLETMAEGIKKMRPEQPKSFEGVVLEHGNEFSDEPFTKEEEALIEKLFEGVPCEMKQCFHSNQTALLRNTYNDLFDQFQYHEGYVAAAIVPVLHAFVTINNKVVDVTLRNHDDYTEDMMTRVRENRKRYDYIGIPFKNKRVIDEVIDRGESFSVIDDWKTGFPMLTGKEDEWIA